MTRSAMLHALIFLGLLRRISEPAAPAHASTFTSGSIIGAPAAEVFRWHEQPGALAALIARRSVAVVAIAAAMLQPANARAQAPPVRTVPFVDLNRYAGDWFEIARFPNRFQRQCVGDVRASYARRADGGIDVVNRCRTADGQTEARGVARLVEAQTHARLTVRFAPAWLSWLPSVWGDYWIIGLASDYSWAVVGDPERNYLWILARTPHPNDDSVAAARAAARDNGFDVGRLIQTPQASRR